MPLYNCDFCDAEFDDSNEEHLEVETQAGTCYVCCNCSVDVGHLLAEPREAEVEREGTKEFVVQWRKSTQERIRSLEKRVALLAKVAPKTTTLAEVLNQRINETEEEYQTGHRQMEEEEDEVTEVDPPSRAAAKKQHKSMSLE